MKTCSRCGEGKDTGRFSKNPSSPDGLRSVCKDCDNKRNAEWREKNRTSASKVPVSATCSYCGEEKPASEFAPAPSRSNGLNHRCNLCHQIRNKERKYGMQEGDFLSLIKSQANRCGICEEMFTESSPPCVDHCHSTKKVRGLLCRSCNLGIGYFKDSKQIMNLAIDYILEHQ